METRSSFETFKSNTCHQVKDLGDIEFIIRLLESNEIRELFERKWYPESLYLLAMLDYLSRENGLPICTNYDDIRACRLQKTVYPSSVLAMTVVMQSDKYKIESFDEAIPEFKRFNIVECGVRQVA
jgi:hypothetical protein